MLPYATFFCIPVHIILPALWLLVAGIGVARGGKGSCPPKFFENIVILCFESRLSKQNSVIRLESNILAPLNFSAPSKLLGWLRHWLQATMSHCIEHKLLAVS